MKNFKGLFFAFIIGALVYHFGKDYIKKLFAKKTVDPPIDKDDDVDETNTTLI